VGVAAERVGGGHSITGGDATDVGSGDLDRRDLGRPASYVGPPPLPPER
jgi:hypothetical protein